MKIITIEEPITDDLVAEIQNKFRPLQTRIPSELKSLEKLIEPLYPSEPYVDWDAWQWTKWDENYLISKGYYRFIKTDKSFYVHGGVTPEETIVPFAVFQKTELSIEGPKISLLDNVFRYAVKSFIKLEIVNPNDISLENVHLEVESPEISYEPATLDELPSKSVIQQKIPCRFPKGIEADSLSLILRFEYGGEEQRFSYEFQIEMKAMMESSLDDLF